jgi:hypothetical protein
VSDFSPEALRKATKDLPPEQGGIGVVAKDGDVGVTAAVNKDLGQPGGWSVAATASWFKGAGYSAAAWLGWKGAEK